jgi:hypothetical protein
LSARDYAGLDNLPDILKVDFLWKNNVNNGKSHEKYWRRRQEPKPNGGFNFDIIF